MTAPAVVLVCPACRRVDGGDLHVRTLTSAEGAVECACGARYPVVDGVPIVVRDVDAWLAGEGAEALRRHDLPAPLARRLALASGGALARNASLLEVYSGSREGPLQEWLRAVVGALPGRVLELGAGLGACDRVDVVALDHNLGLLRHHPGQRVCADAADPPFLPGAFDAVVLPNLLDSCAEPGLVLAQADALLRPGGRLVVTCAYAFQEAITSRSRRFGPDDLRGALDGRTPFLGYTLGQRLLEEVDPIAWPLRLSERLVHTHSVHALISEKGG